MQMLKFGKFAALALAMAVAVGCSSKGGDASGEGADANGGVDPNAGYGANTSGYGSGSGSSYDSGMGSDEAALRAITTFYFEYDSSDLKPEAMRALDVHARDLKGNGARVVLEGHTDERGTREYNMALGERRAKAVQRYLVLQGVSPAQLELVSYGEERPVAGGADEQSWAQNRRVELRK
ncbi:peptidoglycan-associated outer membrane lipoprotein [Azotobacter vinelandii CA]|uniref:Peptidoglycan-associated lipoprotein n=2 Tax=Azotobacter vinelandii TaxID=354 RepID=C1DRF2_AZOVD|nr:peptidoglycan-associated lipoprotein Pal [Azotobacter vinelandii]ACO79810.1 peptidoglycan-associated outer membrane lipoprotein [Azotobacter vinelandii DJ]AGK12427.1 peptidoglycan-associated outer membrane lipoprotein [Azotobacter vinelandii CA]AGK18440.1 peptidoglycan-associated outer membrane lipoprotein [Azotobacter vinelandii CA6]WKN20596.1 peptidoglycan-associated lipoprotein Pal [Azotobacter vinelandii]SFX42950.1 peptidoglycan-associated lipoprotein [Azotobacter vinelandii]